jgi:cobalt-zinc-cadmium efflux system membrane fusion protein
MSRAPERPLPARLLRALPTALAWATLVAVAWWGHHSGWKAPSFASLFGGRSQAADDWCNAHGVPLSRCLACHPELSGADPADWCKEHGVPESKCTVCHPELLKTGVADDWCKEHGVPESCCTICHPEIAHRGDAAPADDGPEVAADETATAPAPTPGKDPRTCQKHALKVQFASVAAIDKAGVRLGVVTERRMAESIPAPASVEYDRAHYANVVARAAGIARFVDRPPGASVAAGDLLAVVDAAEVGRAKSELLAADGADRAAQAALLRIARSVELGTRSEAEGKEAAASAAAAAVRLYDARQALLALGLPLPDGPVSPASVARLGLTEAVLDGPADRRSDWQSANLLPVRAPIDGVVVARDVVAGEAVAAGTPLFAIADTRRLAVRIDLPEASAGRAAPGARVLFRPQSSPDAAYAGAIDWIATALDEHTRTLQMRALVDNADGALRVHAFGTAQVVIRPAATVIAVPNAAVQWEGCCHVVFVRIADTVFQPRKVRLGTRDAACTEILVGVLPGEVVATTGSGVLTAAIQASNLGAGCCGDH